MYSQLLWVLVASGSSVLVDAALSPRDIAPTATVKNGTLCGVHSSTWNQDFFLGIPFAQPPVGNLRFRWPQPLNTSYNGVLDATKYGYSCYQYNSNYNLSEDCLTLNVVRPSGYANQSLPVLIWLYGGGLAKGSSADPQYNLSGIVQVSTLTENPFIGVSINYRLGVWGFLQTPVILGEGSSNAGFLDQRIAFAWVKENIAAFGGDPSRITIWGESAGAQSIGLHLHSFDGRDDGLYSAAIMESGGATGTSLNALPFYHVAAENLTKAVGCPQDWTLKTQIECLRGVSSADLFATNYSVVWNPIVDGTFLTDYPSVLAAQGKFVHIPIIDGANTDEGASFSVTGVNTTQDVFDSLFYWRDYALSPASIRTLLDLYPNEPQNEPPYALITDTVFPKQGLQWRRSATIGGDLVMIAQRRKTCQQYVKGGIENVYSFRFDTPTWNATAPVAVGHGVNVAFSFQNISGTMGPLPQYSNYRALSLGIGKAYANFVGTRNPNGVCGGNQTGLPYWPAYTLESPMNIVLNANGSFVEADTFRAEGIAFINSITREILA